jgi:voltage-gated potassium channel
MLLVVVMPAATLVWQVTRIVKADLPELRAAVPIGFLIPLFFVLFATTYLSMSYGSPASFTEALGHTRALCFTVPIFSTVGFGDITPMIDVGRGAVTAQMILDLIIIGVVFRVLMTAARTGLAADDESGNDAVWPLGAAPVADADSVFPLPRCIAMSHALRSAPTDSVCAAAGLRRAGTTGVGRA